MEKTYGIVPYMFYQNNMRIYIYENKNGNFLFFKGKQEKNETNEETAIREFFEETGLIVKKEYLEKYFETKSKNKLIGLYLINVNNIENYFISKKKTEDIYKRVWIDCDYENRFVKNQKNLFIKICNELKKEKYKLINNFFA